MTRTVFIACAGLDVGAALARGLLARGARVALIDDASRAMPGDGAADAQAEPAPAGSTHIAARFDTRAAIERAFAAASARLGAPDQMVLSALPPAALQAQATHTLDPAQWREGCHDAIQTLLHLLQEAFAQLKERGGAITALGPALSLAGAGRLAALSAALEGQRGLVKSSARQWGRRRVSVNWVAAAPRALAPLFAALPLPLKADAVPVALGEGPSLEGGLVGLLHFLGSEDGRALTGATLVADGGQWMVP
jgi:NAD(P)-dependent dehydrogenase (short-subunit alcohol dehydrogenase family)